MCVCACVCLSVSLQAPKCSLAFKALFKLPLGEIFGGFFCVFVLVKFSVVGGKGPLPGVYFGCENCCPGYMFVLSKGQRKERRGS